MKNYKVTYRYQKDGGSRYLKDEVVPSGSEAEAIKLFLDGYAEAASDSVSIISAARLGDGLELRYYDSDPDDEEEHTVRIDKVRAKGINGR